MQDYEHGPNYLNFQDVSVSRLLLLGQAGAALCAHTRSAPSRAAAAAAAAAHTPPPSLARTTYPKKQWPNRKAKIGAWIAGMMVTGVGLPCFAVWWQQNKLKG